MGPGGNEIAYTFEDCGASMVRKTVPAGGELFRARVAPILSAVDAIPATMHAGETTSVIRLKVLSASALIPDILARFQRLEPQIRSRLLQSNAVEDVDLTIFASPNEIGLALDMI